MKIMKLYEIHKIQWNFMNFFAFLWKGPFGQLTTMRSVIDFEAIVKNRTLVVGSPCRSSGGHSWDDVVDTSHDDLDISLKQGLIVVVFVGLHFSYLPIPRLPKPLEPSRCP